MPKKRHSLEQIVGKLRDEDAVLVMDNEWGNETSPITPFLGDYPIRFHLAPRPFPRDSISPSALSSFRTKRIMSRPTVGHARPTSLMVNSPKKWLIAS